MRQFLQGWPNSHVLLFLPQISKSVAPCIHVRLNPLCLNCGIPWSESGLGSLVCNHPCPELDPDNESIATVFKRGVSGSPVTLHRPVKRKVVFWELFVSLRKNSTKLLWFYKQPFVIDIISKSVREIKIQGDTTKCTKNTSTKELYIYIAESLLSGWEIPGDGRQGWQSEKINYWNFFQHYS